MQMCTSQEHMQEAVRRQVLLSEEEKRRELKMKCNIANCERRGGLREFLDHFLPYIL